MSGAERSSILLHGLMVFAATFALAIWGGSKVYAVGAYVPPAMLSVPYFLALFLVMTALVLALLRWTERGVLFQALFTLAMLSGAWFLAGILLPPPWGLVTGSAFVLARFRWKKVAVLNLTLAVGIAGISASVASSLTANAVLVIFTILAFYDIVAVYATGHMVRMFRDLAGRGVLLAFVLPPLGIRSLSAQAETVSGRAMYLGSGDIALPAMLAVAAMRGGFVHGLAAALGAMAGFALLVLLFMAQPKRRPMPALPPIALGSASFYLASLLMFS